MRRHPVLKRYKLAQSVQFFFAEVLDGVEILHAKLIYFPGLLPGKMKGEDEHLAIGGVVEANLD
ncbi:MAG: hypothetical protein U9Q75_12260 [Pseudomonadota bacterium]|nr:hypothetical protein [Pseudomonadota bacterium]